MTLLGGQQKEHLMCKKSCFSKPERFLFERAYGSQIHKSKLGIEREKMVVVCNGLRLTDCQKLL